MNAGNREEKVKKIKNTFVSLIWVATRQFSQWIQTFGITHSQFFTLSSLVCHKEPCTMRDLTEVTFQDPPTMTGIIDRLVKMKLVERTRSEIDRRVVLVQATPSGIDLVEKIREKAAQEDMRAYDALANEELDALQQSLFYMLRLHVGRYTSLKGEELDTEVERLLNFKNDPIQFMKVNDENQIKVQN